MDPAETETVVPLPHHPVLEEDPEIAVDDVDSLSHRIEHLEIFSSSSLVTAHL